MAGYLGNLNFGGHPGEEGSEGSDLRRLTGFRIAWPDPFLIFFTFTLSGWELLDIAALVASFFVSFFLVVCYRLGLFQLIKIRWTRCLKTTTHY